MKLKTILILFGLFILLTSCENPLLENNNKSHSVVMSMSPPPTGSAEEVMEEQTQEEERKLIKEGALEYRTDNLIKTRKSILDAVKNNNGYVSSDQEQKTEEKIIHILTIRVPALKFDNLLNGISVGVENFDLKEIKINDVTEQFLDVQARIKTKKELENRYLDLLKKATKVTEMLEIERELSQLRTDIESMEGKINYLKNKVALSTLTVTYYERTGKETAYSTKFKDGFLDGLKSLILFFVAVVSIWPFILLFGLLIFVIGYWKKRKILSQGL